MKKFFLITVGVIFILSVALTATVQAAPVEQPQYDDPSPTYWLGDSFTVSVDGCGGYWCDKEIDPELSEYLSTGSTAGRSHFTPPEDNTIAGFIYSVSSVGWDGWVKARHAGNTTWFPELQSLTLGSDYCNGTVEACSWAGVMDPGGSFTSYTYPNYIPDTYMHLEEGSNSSGISWTLTPIFYGTPDPDWCSPLTDENSEVTQVATLAGTDEVGHIHELESGTDYLLYTAEGPWNDGTDDSYEVAIRFQDEDTWGDWVELGSFSSDEEQPLCDDSWLDANSTAVAFTASDETDQLQIRVNDIDDEFDDNSGTIDYHLNNGTESGYGSCADYYTAGSLKHYGLVSATYDGDRSITIHKNEDFSPNTAYIYKVKDAWQDNGSDSVDTEIQPFIQGDSGWTTWLQDDDIAPYDCVVETDTTKDVYFTSPDSWRNAYFDYVYLDIRPDDSDGNYGNNSGDFIFNFLEADYNAPAADCAARYERGTYMESPVLHASASNGVELPYTSNGFTVGNVYSITNVDSPGAYYSMNGDPYRTFEISEDGDTWYDMDIFADCVSPLDSVRYEYFFTADQDHYYFRTEQGAPWVDEVSGTLPLNLYGAIDNGYDDGADCDDYFSANQLVYEGSVDADDSSGEWIRHVFDPGEIYAIHITDPAYTGLGGSPSYSFDIRHEDFLSGPSGEYTPWGTWSGALCQDNDPANPDKRISLYFQAQPGTYEIRATGPHATNSGTLHYQIYTTSRDVDPAINDCELRDYGDIDYWYPVAEFEVNANDNNPDDPGHLIANELTSTAKYKVEVSAGPTGGATTGSGMSITSLDQLEISTDNGANWTLLDDWLSCVVPVGDYLRGYFSNPSDDLGPYRVRVYDPGGNYLDNVGSLTFKIYSDYNEDVNDWIYDESSIPGGSGDGCYATCVRPGGWLEVGAWVEYVRCRFTSYISWCPWHTDRMVALSRLFYDVEPFGTILEVIDTATAIKTEVEAYEWTDEGGGGAGGQTVQAPRNFVLAPGEGGGADIPLVGEDTIWGSGEMHLLGAATSYSTECNNLLADSLGDRLSVPLCFTFNVVDQLGLKTWFQWIWDMAMIAGLMFYISKRWVDLMQ